MIGVSKLNTNTKVQVIEMSKLEIENRIKTVSKRRNY